MQLQKQKPRQTLNPAYRRQRPSRTEINKFKANLLTLIGKVDESESEEHVKNLVRDFLRDTYYKDTNEVNTKGRQDLAIYTGKTNDSKVGVIIEAKRPKNANEWFKGDSANCKAFQELVLYYLRERENLKNLDIKYLIATNIYEWYIIEASYFENLFFGNKNFLKDFVEFDKKQKVTTNTDLFYNSIAKPFIDSIDKTIPCAYFNIKDFDKALRNNDKKEDANLIALIKILSPSHLLKLEFADDSNSLKESFYKELLHIIGLEERKENGKYIIDRKLEGNRNEGSLIENAINMIETEDPLHKIADLSLYGTTKEERIYNIALELCITWINRILFLKLLEGQLQNYHQKNPDYLFLNSEMIPNYDELHKLFHQVLAKTHKERTAAVNEKYKRVPYLNSSLFDISKLEDATIKINSLDNDHTLELISSTVLKEIKKKNQGLPALDYLFRFLNAFDFSSEGGEEIQEDENRTLINASVLGKVFEKINGYKDGSIFTPGFITMYMCRQAIRAAVVQKFKDEHQWKIEEFADLKNFLKDRRTTKNILEDNALINSIHLCDPAVGSGHFLVSSLNEIIAIKSELGLLADKSGDRLSDYQIVIAQDELIVTDQNGNDFKYEISNGKPLSKEMQRLQKALFEEKQTIIENCLFGVDINPNSVKICGLRLWIELLKNAYYKEDTNFQELETLPNIDINIKCNNSLISRFALDADLSKALKSIKYNVEHYKGFVNEYKNAKSREVKRGLEQIIDTIKSDFRTEINKNDSKHIRLRKISGDLFNHLNQTKMFDLEPKQKKAFKEKKEKLEEEINKLSNQIKEIENNAAYKNAFEWRFEFPEVLDNEGNFEGFDLIIGNPPYISNWDLSEANRPLVLFLEQEYSPYLNGHWDLFGCFIYKGVQLLKKNGINTFILPTSFYKEKHSTELRKYFIENVQIKELIDFKEAIVFEGIARQTGIYSVKKEFVEKNEINVKFSIEEKGRMIPQSFFSQLKNNAFKTNVSDLDITIYNKLLVDSVMLGNIVCINTGVVAHSKVGSPIKFTKDDVIHKKFQKGFKKYIVGSNISQYNIVFDNDYMDYESKKECFHRPKFPMLFESEKIVVRRISGSHNKFMSCFDDTGYYTNDNVMHLLLWNKKLLEYQKPEKKWDYILDSKLSLKYLVAIINSKLNTYYFSKFLSTDTLQGTYSSIYPEDIRQIPIKNISAKEQQPLISLVEKIQTQKQQGKDSTDNEKKIDELVYKLYNLTEKEIKTIEAIVN